MALDILAVSRYKTTMDIDHIRRELEEALEEHKLTQYEFAAKHGLSYSSLNKFLKEKMRNPRLNSIKAFEQAVVAERSLTNRA